MQSKGKADSSKRWLGVGRCISLMVADTIVPCCLLQAEQMHLQQAMQHVALHRLHFEG